VERHRERIVARPAGQYSRGFAVHERPPRRSGVDGERFANQLVSEGNRRSLIVEEAGAHSGLDVFE
jgi:hypothetical protein